MRGRGGRPLTARRGGAWRRLAAFRLAPGVALTLVLLVAGPWRHAPGQGRGPAREDRARARVHADDHRRRAALARATCAGKVVAVTFIYARCTDTCPLLTAKMAGMQKRLGSDFGPKVRFVVDHRGSRARHAGGPRAVRPAHGANPAGWAFLTGTPGRDPGRRTAVRHLRAEDRAGRRRSHLPDLDHRPRGRCASSISASASIPTSSCATCGACSGRRRPPMIDWLPRLVAPPARSRHGPRQAPRRVPGHRRPADRGRRGRPPGAERSEPARRGHGQAPAQDRRLPPAPARHDRPALQRGLRPARSRRPDARGDAAPAQPVRLRPGPARSSSPRTRSSSSAACGRTTRSSSGSSPRWSS